MSTHRIAGFVLITLNSLAAASAAVAEDMSTFDLVTLMNMDITVVSAARRAQSAADTAAAVFVITREDIRRSGATTIPELLRLAPGVQVARSGYNAWSVTVRGFGHHFANKLLVMIDGRSIYETIYSGVFWEEQQVPLETIERIEVIRGPGGALWGANAVNGVINIITSAAAGNAGWQIAAGSGDRERASSYVSYSGRSVPLGDYRFHIDYFRREPYDDEPIHWDQLQAGWRLDRALAGGQLKFHGKAYEAHLGNDPQSIFATTPDKSRGGYAMAAWDGELFGADRFAVQSYYDWIERRTPGAVDFKNLDFEIQYTAARRGRHLLTAGAGVRRVSDGVDISLFTLADADAARYQWNAYAQDDIYFLDDRLRFTLGAKFEQFETTEAALQPTTRIWWRANDAHILWAAASRAVHTPARGELQTHISFVQPGAPPVRIDLRGNNALNNEKLDAYELGWRWRADPRLSYDVTVFEHRYDDVIQQQRSAPVFDPGPPPALTLNARYENLTNARTRGVELAAEWRAHERLRVHGNGMWFQMRAPQVNGANASFIGVDPRRSFLIGASLDLPWRLEGDLAWRWIDEIPAYGITAYDSLNARLGWRPVATFDLALSIDNLLDNQHAEFPDLGATTSKTFGRSLFLRLNWTPRS